MVTEHCTTQADSSAERNNAPSLGTSSTWPEHTYDVGVTKADNFDTVLYGESHTDLIVGEMVREQAWVDCRVTMTGLMFGPGLPSAGVQCVWNDLLMDWVLPTYMPPRKPRLARTGAVLSRLAFVGALAALVAVGIQTVSS